MKKSTLSKVHLFIDSNILLYFYAYSKDDLAQLSKLVTLVKAKTIKLYLTQQVVNEVNRNRDTILADSFKSFRVSAQGIPNFLLNMVEASAYREALQSLEQAQASLIKAGRKAANDRTLAADEVLEFLFEEATVIPVEDKEPVAAERRHRLGNPPGKRESMGDQLNWEMLVASVPKGTTLHIVTNDSDYASKLNGTEPNVFLLKEWQAKNGGTLQLYERIGQYFQANFPDEDFTLVVEKREAMARLIESPDFATTHTAVAVLTPYLPHFSTEEFEELSQGILGNSQVRWIASDPDVEAFLSLLVDVYGEHLSASSLKKLRILLEREDQDPVSDDDDDDH